MLFGYNGVRYAVDKQANRLSFSTLQSAGGFPSPELPAAPRSPSLAARSITVIMRPAEVSHA